MQATQDISHGENVKAPDIPFNLSRNPLILQMNEIRFFEERVFAFAR